MRYEVRAALAMGALVAVGAVGFIGLQQAMAPPVREFAPGESTQSFAVRHPELIRPSAADFAAGAAEDAAWRARYAATPGTSTGTAAGGLWRPSPRQRLDDSVYALMRSDRLNEAIDLLVAWVEQHPTDREELLKLARLLNQAGRSEEALPRYRQILALDSAGRR
jgi:Flp pilus assembly protein TadD